MKIRVYNLVHREHVPLHLPLIVGDIDFKVDDGEIDVWNASRMETKAKATKWPIVEGAFKVLVQLIPGENCINLKHQDEILQLILVFTFPHFKYFVRPIYIVLADDAGCFQGPDGEDCSVDSALERIKIGAMLIQTFTAEKMKEQGFGRQTFQLECDANYEPVCNVFKSKLTLQRAHSMTGNELWNYFARELMTASSFSKKDLCKWYCFMSFTRYNPPPLESPKTHSEILKHTKGHTALGGGGLALFGTGNLHTWAAKISEVYHRFTDKRKIDRSRLMDDSAYREFHWANYSTGLGASLHELGHTFDLAHTPSGIMARGFDDLNKVFTVQRTKESLTKDEATLGNEQLSALKPVNKDIEDRRQKDICFGSPFRKLHRGSSTSSNMYIAPPPVMFKLEKGFTPVSTQQTVSISMRNYDGSQTHKTITKDIAFESVTEVVLGEAGQVLSKNITRERHPSTGSTSSSLSRSSQSPVPVIPSTLPNSPKTSDFHPPSIEHVDDGAHWYRASAVFLRFHRWFNNFNNGESRKNITLSGSSVRSNFGLRLIELRSEPDGEVFHHWEFLSKIPPTQFTLRESSVKNLPAEAKVVTIVTEDNVGNVLRRKIDLADFES